MQPSLKNKKTLLAAALLMSMSNVSMAANEAFTITAQAIPDVSINFVQNLSFGTAVYVTSGGSCTLDALVPSEALIQADTQGTDDTISAAAGGNFGGVSGTGCVDGTTNNSQAGMYKIGGDPGALVALTLAPLVETAFTYTPSLGCYVLYDDDNVAGADAAGDPCNFLTVGTTNNLVIGDATTFDDHGEVDGELVFSIGGTIDITNAATDLTAGQLYTGLFDIVVVYE